MGDAGRTRWRWLKRLLLAGPILLVTGLGILTAHQRSSIGALLGDPNELVWQSQAVRLEVREHEERDGTVSTHVIQVRRDDGSVAHESTFEIDWDAGLTGGGFVKTMQADSDPEPEVVAWASNAGSAEASQPFFLDHVQGEVAKHPFGDASEQAEQLALRWRQVHVIRDLEITLVVIASIAYYVLCGLLAGGFAIVRRLRRRARDT